MAGRELASRIAVGLLVVVVLAMVLGQLVGQPMLFGFVTTGSMAPTLQPGDGFVAVPAFLAGEARPGDVVVYEAESVQGGGLTTHRVVERTERGYVTRGDANPFTDQDGGEPYVTERAIRAHVLRVGGSVVSIPYLGTAAGGVQGVVAAPFALLGDEESGPVLMAVGLALFVLAGATGRGSRRETSRSRARENVLAVWLLILGLSLALTVAATAGMAVPSGTYEIETVATLDPSDNSQVVRPGETATATYESHNGGVVPILVVSDPLDRGVDVEPRRTVLGFGERQETTVRMETPDSPGEYTWRVRESRYLVLLPPAVLAALHGVHPLIALLAVDLVIVLFVVAVVVAIFGSGYLRVRPGPEVPLRVKVYRRLRRWR